MSDPIPLAELVAKRERRIVHVHVRDDNAGGAP